MTPIDTDTDPWQAAAQTAWRNRVAEWRDAPAEPLLHGLALIALAALLLPLSWNVLLEVAAGARGWLTGGWPQALAAWLGFAIWQLRQAMAASQQRRAHSWLAAQPVPAAIGRRHDRRRALRVAALHALLVLAIGSAWQIDRALLLGLFATPWLAWAIASLWPPRASPLSSRRDARDTLFAPRGIGRVWRWQLIEIGSLLAPRRLAWLLVGWLLVPSGTALPVALVFALGIVLAAGGVAAWQRALAVLPAAQRWLDVQPLPPARLLITWIGLPAALLAAIAAVLAGMMPLFGAPALTWPVASGVVMVGLLQSACIAASRHRPRAASLRFAVHLSLLLGAWQVLPPLVLLAWPLQIALLVRRSLRT